MYTSTLMLRLEVRTPHTSTWLPCLIFAQGFVAPFINPDLLWDFRVPLVCSINVSGHKYGCANLTFIDSKRRSSCLRLTYAGVGWALWRSKEFLPESILFHINYLGSPQISFTLNFSKTGVQVIGQCQCSFHAGIVA